MNNVYFFNFAELRPSCRTVFDASIAKLSDDEASDLVDQWHRRREFRESIILTLP